MGRVPSAVSADARRRDAGKAGPCPGAATPQMPARRRNPEGAWGLRATHAITRTGSSVLERPVKARIDAFVIDSETRQLTRGGDEIHLSPKAFAVLCALVEKRPNVVPKADLFGQIWPDVFVVEGNLFRRGEPTDMEGARAVTTEDSRCLSIIHTQASNRH